jgi:hypothetical protein
MNFEMKVKHYYSFLSTQRMFEWSLEPSTPMNRRKAQHYAFFHSVQDCSMKELTLEELSRLADIAELQMKEFKPTRRSK